jgi:hypothetical protein
MYQPDSSHRDHLNKLGNEFQEMVVAMSKAQVEYDIGCEDIIARHGSVEGPVFKVGQRAYETVILPPHTENLNSKTIELLEAYTKSGGKVICCGPPPGLVDAQPSNRAKTAEQNASWRKIEANVISTVLPNPSDGFVIFHNDGDQGILLHHRRKLDDGDLLFVTNTSIDSSCSASVISPARSVEQWDLDTGTISSYPFVKNPKGISVKVELAPCGSLLLFLSEKPGKPAPEEVRRTTAISAVAEPTIKRIASNVLTIDYVDVTAGGETKKNIYFYQASKFVFAKNGMGRNPWDSAVQFRDELIKKKFAADSGFASTYRFSIEKQVPDSLYIVIERPDLYSIKCNGIPVSAIKDSWWLDKAFGKIDISAAAKAGENVVTIEAAPMTIYHELEPAYILGDFMLKPMDSGFVIVPERKLDLDIGWNQQGHPFYAEGVSYTQRFDIPRPTGQYQVHLPHWYGSVAEVIVNGQPAGYIGYQPWQCDVTPLVKRGTNNIEIVVIGTLKNTLGPHHAGRGLGAAWPNMFQRAPKTGPPPGNQYHTVGYGLFKPFVLKNTVKQVPR